jgi:hypothetical protein
MARVEIEIEDQLLDELSEALFWEQERDTSAKELLAPKEQIRDRYRRRRTDIT